LISEITNSDEQWLKRNRDRRI